MALPRHLFAPAFRHQRLSLFFAAIVGIMVYLATFAMAAEATLSAITFTWDQGMESHMTVEIPAAEDEATMPQTERIKQALAILHAMPNIESATQLSDEEVARLLKPWITQPELLKTLPIPTLIDIMRKPGTSLNPTDIQTDLKPAVSNARVDDHAAWLADMVHLVHGIIAVGGLMIILTGITLVVSVNLICRAIMATERETVTLLHTMGAEDEDIAQHFQFHAQRLSGPAALVGFILAVISAGALLYFLRHFADPTSLHIVHWIGLGIATLLVPLIAVWISAVSARMSALKLLHTMP